MPVCPTTICNSVFGSERALAVHLTKSKRCKEWVARNAASRPRLDPDDLETWPSRQPEPLGDWHEFTESVAESEGGFDVIEEMFEFEEDILVDMDPINTSPVNQGDIQMGECGTRHLPPTNSSGVPKRYYRRPFSDSKKRLGRGETPYQITMKGEKDRENPAYPFAGPIEWEFAKWLGESGLPNTRIDALLKLPWVCFKSFYLILNQYAYISF